MNTQYRGRIENKRRRNSNNHRPYCLRCTNSPLLCRSGASLLSAGQHPKSSASSSPPPVHPKTPQTGARTPPKSSTSNSFPGDETPNRRPKVDTRKRHEIARQHYKLPHANRLPRPPGRTAVSSTHVPFLGATVAPSIITEFSRSQAIIQNKFSDIPGS